MFTRRQAVQEGAARERSAAALPINRLGPWLSQRARAIQAETLLAAAVIVASFFVALLWAAIIPFGEAPDEPTHFDEARFIAEHNRFPVFDQETDLLQTSCAGPTGPCGTSYAVLPGVNYAISAGFMKLQHAFTGEPYDSLHFAARLTSVLSIPIYVFFLWMTAQLLLAQRLARVTALLLGSFIPQVAFIGGYVNADAFSLAVGAAVTYLSVRLLCNGYSRFMPLYGGVALGLLALSRANYYPLFGLFAVAWAFAAYRMWQQDGTARRLVLSSLATAALAAVIGGWWYIRNFQLYGEPLGLDTINAAFDALAPLRQSPADRGATFTSLLFDDPVWTKSTFRSFWATFGWMAVFLNSRIYLLIEAMLFGAAAGLVIAAYRALSEHGRRVWQWGSSWAWLLLALLLPAAILLSAWTSLYNDYQPQGRYLYPALIPVVLLTSHGLHSLWDNGVYRQTVTLLVGGGMVLLNLYSLIFVLVPLYYK